MSAAEDAGGRVLLFVYGTLKRGGCNHALIAGQKFVAEARTLPVFRMFDLGGYPGIAHANPGLRVAGELWHVSTECLARLDALEGLDEGEYTRERISLEPPHEDIEAAGYVYARPVEGCREIAGGVW